MAELPDLAAPEMGPALLPGWNDWQIEPGCATIIRWEGSEPRVLDVEHENLARAWRLAIVEAVIAQKAAE